MAAITSAIAAGVGTAASIGMKAAGAAGAFGGGEQAPGEVPGPQGQNPMAQPAPQPAFAGQVPQMDPLKDPFGGGMPGGGGWV